MKLYYDEHGIVRVASSKPIITNIYKSVDVDPSKLVESPIGKRVVFQGHQGGSGVRLAVVCNWGDACGIATYAEYLVNSMRPLLSDVRIFAEDIAGDGRQGGALEVDRCWKRGQSMAVAARRLVDWRPSAVLIQHEFGIFPRAPYMLQLLQALDANAIPYAVTLHSVYEHLDKVVCSSAMRNIVVHSPSGEACLRRLGHTSTIRVIPHGCVRHEEVGENWNITQTPYAIVQFGFGFGYKGVDVALEAVARLKRMDPEKYGGDTPVHYCYLCSESPHVKNINNDYYRMLVGKIEELGLVDNAVIVRGFQTEEVLNQYLRTYKLAVFPYVQDSRNVVYGASGAARLAMANRTPTIVSTSHMFDDLEGVLARAGDAADLARHIDVFFSDYRVRDRMIREADEYIARNSWPITARRYYDFLAGLVDSDSTQRIVV